MTQAETRGFEYALEPVRCRAHYRVDAAIGELGESQRALAKAREEAEAALQRCREMAALCTPLAQAVIDPVRAVAAARQMQMLREALAAAELRVQTREKALTEAKGQLDRARVEQETFDAHRADALQEHAVEQSRRLQAAADQDWLARRFSIGRRAAADGDEGEQR